MQPIDLDSCATTPLLPAVLAAMAPYWSETYGNPASAHQAGRRARQALEDARERIASLLGACADEVIFTSGATEANNLALGLAGAPPGGLIVSPVEHPSVVEPARRLAEMGFTVDWLPVNSQGIVAAEELARQIGPETRLVCIQYVNHETGVVQPIAQLVDDVRERCHFHCDASQAAGKLPIHFHQLGLTALTLSGHKFHGPKGIGALLLKRRAPLQPQLRGGHQQQGRRPGTEPVGLAVGLAAALQFAHDEMEHRRHTVENLRRRFLEILRERAQPIRINPEEGTTLPHTLNLSFPGCAADILLMKLDLAGVACSTGSACSSGSLLPSPVLQAMGVSNDRLRSAMRFSFSPFLTEAEVADAANRVANVVCELRNLAISNT